MRVYHTEKREELLLLFTMSPNRAFTLDELTDALLPDGKGKSTLYRLLAKFVDEGTVRKMSDGHTRHFTYQYMPCGHASEHVHLKCESCGKMIHLDHQISDDLKNRLSVVSGFTLNENKTLLFGVCKACRIKEKRKGFPA